MLDFYLINDAQAKPKYPKQVGLEFVGQLDEETFGNLQNKGILDLRLDYYSDFRMGTTEIKQIRQTIINKQIDSDSDVKKLMELLDFADKKQCGLMAFGD